MIRSLVVLLAAAGLIATLDLAHKALSISERGGAVLAHDRSALYVLGVAAASAVWAGAVVLARSDSIALAAGLLVGGAVGNLVSLALWPSLPGVPDPFVAGRVAFNVADTADALGLALLLPATLVFAVRNRKRLCEPVRLRGP